jgi:hypothetical protein
MARLAVSSQVRGQRVVEVTALLSAPDELEHPVQGRRVPAGVLFRRDRGQVPDERIAGGHLPPGLQQVEEPGGR